MKRLIACLMICVEAAAFWNLSRTDLALAVAFPLALAHLAPRLRVKLQWQREAIYSLTLVFPFLLMYRLSPGSPSDPMGLVDYRFTYYMTVYFVLLQILQFFLRRAEELPIYMPLYGALAMTCAGNVMATPQQDRSYQLFATLFTVLAATYLLSFRPPSAKSPVKSSGPRFLYVAGTLCAALFAASVAGRWIHRYQDVMDQAFMNLMSRIPVGDVTGFSMTTELGSVTRLRLGPLENRPALRIFSEENPGYVRGRVYETYRHSRWKDTGNKVKLSPVDDLPGNLPLDRYGRNGFRLKSGESPSWNAFEIWPDATIGQGMFLPQGTSIVRAPVRSIDYDANMVVDSGDLLPGMNYASYAPAKVSQDTQVPSQWKDFLWLSPDLDPQIRVLAKEVFAGSSTTSRKIGAVTRFFLENYQYSLDITIPQSIDPLTYFLLQRPDAYCEYFASGAALLLRVAGVPTRYVTGFVAVGYNRHGGYWVARHKDAHAWCEAYDGEKGWVLVEATPPSGRPNESSSGNLAERWDTIKLRFQELIARLRTQGMKGLGMWILDRFRPLLRLLLQNSTVSWVLRAGLLLLAVGGILCRLRQRKVPPPRDPNLQSLRRLLGQMDRRLRKHDLVRRETETLQQFAERITSDGLPPEVSASLVSWYVEYASVRFGGTADPVAVQRLEENMPRL
ncbi:MAG: transglutaminase domain-containing protein [Armatimonadetes bacterium]|nr:transglutaminase domain-containing protein [Armatimonadota bacterium]